MRRDLNMRKGKMVAQGAHASCSFFTHVLSHKNYEFTKAELAWLEGRFTKICVSVDSEEELLEIHQKALDAGLKSFLIRDAGLTEFHGCATLTCCAIGPDFPDRLDPVTGKLKLL